MIRLFGFITGLAAGLAVVALALNWAFRPPEGAA